MEGHMTTAAVLATLDEYADAYCSKDTDRLMAIFDPGDDITVIGTGNDELCTGQQQVRDLFNRNFAEATATRFEHHWNHATIRGDIAERDSAHPDLHSFAGRPA